MRRLTTPLGLLALALAGLGVWWLMQRNLQLAAYAVVALLVTMLVVAVISWFREHRARSLVLAGLVLALVAACGGYVWNLQGKIDDIPRLPVPAALDKGSRPGATTALNILLLGTDNPTPKIDKPTVAELLAQDTWDPGAYRSDSMMLVHIPKDRRSAVVVSIPRDSYVPIYDAEGTRYSRNKINAAFSYYGPYGTLRTVEKLTNLRIDHLAMIDFEGFRDLTTALGGVDVYISEDVTDPLSKQHWSKGMTHLEGDLALKYVRMRYGLTNGDFDRVARQQNFLRAVMAKMIDNGTIGNPVTVINTVDAIVKYLSVDADWTSGDIRDLTLGLRHLKQQKISYVTLALDHYESIDGVGAANIIDEQRTKDLFLAIRNDDINHYLRKNPDDVLPEPDSVS